MTDRGGLRPALDVSELPEEVRVGRSETCDVCIDDPTVSREHLRMEVSRDALYAENVSRYGTLIVRHGEVEVLSGTRAIYPGDALMLGDNTRLEFRQPGVPDWTLPGGATVIPARAAGRAEQLPELSAAEGALLETIASWLDSGRPLPTNTELAATMFKSEATIRTHLLHIYAKANVDATGPAKRVRLAELARAYANRPPPLSA